MADRRRIGQAVLAIHFSLLFAWFHTAHAYVEPPTNVTFHCHNLHDLLRWSYELPVPAGLRFRVNIFSVESPSSHVWVEPPALQANLSLLTDPEDDNQLSVTAVVGEEASEEAGEITFTYSSVSLVQRKCSVDFPPVVVNRHPDGHLWFRFQHPWLSYGSSLPPAKSRQKKSNEEQRLRSTPEFSYTVTVNQHLEEDFVCDTEVCEEELPKDPEQEQQCLSVRGVMKTMSVLGSQQYCASTAAALAPENKNVQVVAGAVTAVVVLALAAVGLIVYRKKTNPSAFSPRATTITGQRKPQTLVLPKDSVSVPEVSPRSPTPLLSNQSEEEEVTPVYPPTVCDLRLRLGVENGVAEEVCSGGGGGGGGGGGEYMAGSELEEVAVNESPYERRPVVRVELAPGEGAEGYRQGGR